MPTITTADYCKPCARTGAVLFIVLGLAGCPDTPTQDPGEEQTIPSYLPAYPEDCVPNAPAVTSAANQQQQVVCIDGQTKILARHLPLYKPDPHESIIQAAATNTASGLHRITIHAIRGTLTDCTELGISPSIIPCRKDETTLPARVCHFVTPVESAECQMSISLSDRDLVSYIAVAEPESGPSIATPPITYAGGTPLDDVAAPVWWHTGSPYLGLSVARLNIALYPDPDFSDDMGEFGKRLSDIVRWTFFSDSKVSSRVYTGNRHFFDIWAFPHKGAVADANSVVCNHTFTGSAATMDGLMHGSAILHTRNFTDCASISTDGGAGSIDTSVPLSAWLLVHESGHFLFGLADEYGDGGQTAKSDPPNVFDSAPICDLAKSSYAGASCLQFGTTPSFRIKTTEPETMKEPFYTSDFRNTSDAAVTNRLSKCAGGDCQ